MGLVSGLPRGEMGLGCGRGLYASRGREECGYWTLTSSLTRWKRVVYSLMMGRKLLMGSGEGIGMG